MKRCPKCGVVYQDDTLNFCLDDGEWLVVDQADEPATALFDAAVSGSGAGRSTSSQIHTTARTEVFSPDSVPGERPASAITINKRFVMLAAFVLAFASAGLGYWYFVARSGSTSSSISSVAVLPFQNRSDDADTDYLSDGLAESLIFRLTQLPNLKVSPTSSVMRYKGKESDIAKIASELGVEAVMTGRLSKRGDNLNITVELVDARNNKSLWGEQYERKMSDLLATQREIASTIAQKLQVKLSGSETGVTKKYTDNNEAYQLWMKARFHFARRTKEDMEKSIELFKQATELDPKFALAYVGIAESYTTMPSYPYMSPQEAYPKARVAIARALELDPDLPEGHAVAGMLAAADEWDYPKAERELKRSIELGTNLAITHYRYGWTYLSPLGRHDEAVGEMKRAMELEPLSIQQGANYAAVLMYARRFDEAVEVARRTYELDTNHIGARNWLCHTLNASGRSAEALNIAEPSLKEDRAKVSSLNPCMGIAYAKTGQREKAVEMISRMKEAGKSQYVMTYWIGLIYAALGEKDQAFAELEESFKNRDWFVPRMKVDPFMDPLRDDPRFDAMVKRLNLPQ